MKYDPSNNVLTNYGGLITDLPDSVWTQRFRASKINTEVGIIIANPSEDTDNGIVTGTTKVYGRGVICETEQLSCSPPHINMETQTRSCSEDSLTCIISCKPGFVLDDGSTSITLTCQDNLEWDGEVSTCRLAILPIAE
uniref:uncharacterized protein LOC120345793 n=1 Tax=Styela clava TaxID=7725 RepID=UPI00193A4297|nr:uncharacterized protein LOC120345793 [Styela clava]